ncbi:hypothetical protein SpCBS45565_g03381 [Spizellomyces sp. 'palustris']|nr:hypothetical protein SpCBS45565_g03381 [Spizellomyces sp. 'palustris']
MGEGKLYDVPSYEMAPPEGGPLAHRRPSVREMQQDNYNREARMFDPASSGAGRVRRPSANHDFAMRNGLPIDTEDAGAAALHPDDAAYAAAAAAYQDALVMNAASLPGTPYATVRPSYALGGLATPQTPHMPLGAFTPNAHALLMHQQQLTTASVNSHLGTVPARYMAGARPYNSAPLPSSPATRPPYTRKRSVTSDGSTSSGSATTERRGSGETTTSGSPTKIDRELKKMSLYKTELCRSWEETGTCRYGNKCQFAHSETELRPVDRHPKYKTEMCKTFWEKGTCPYGKRCCFIHTEKDVEKKLQDIDKKLIVIRKPSDEKTAGLSVQTRDRASTLSSSHESIMGVGDEPGDNVQSPTHASFINTAPPKSVTAAPTHLYDHRAIADAYFSGRRPSVDIAPMADGYSAQQDQDVEHLNKMLRDTRLGSPTEVGMASLPLAGYTEQRRLSYADMRHEVTFAEGAANYPDLYPHHVQSHLLAPPVPNSVMYDAMASGNHIPSVHSTSSNAMATPPRERTRRARSVTQPSTLITPNQRSWVKGRSESFSGFLPGTPLHIDPSTGMITDQHYLSPSSPSTAYATSKGMTYQQHAQLLSPPPSGHPSPVREAIIEEDTLNEGEVQSYSDAGHRLPIFKNIKKVAV